MIVPSSGSHLANYWYIHSLGLHASEYLKVFNEATRLARLLETTSHPRTVLGYLELTLKCHRESLCLTLFVDAVLEMALCYSKS